MSEPFFIIGAPRSGTTLLRDLLREHPRLECPEETFFYRWSEPFGTRRYEHFYRFNPVILRHRKIDGISEEEFWNIFNSAGNRIQLQTNYMKKFLEKQSNPEGVWFDKTPQNTQGIGRLAADFPRSKIVNVVRNPLNVVTSIMQGRSVGPETLIGATNMWSEAVWSTWMAKPVCPGRIYDLKYEDLVENPEQELAQLVEFLDFEPMDFPATPITPQNSRFLNYLNDAQIDFILALCAPLLNLHGYPSDRESSIRQTSQM